MAGALSFQIAIYQTNTDVLPQLQQRVKDLTALFEQIISEWTKGNVQKFGAATGQSLAGASIDTVQWEGLSPAYFKQKSRNYPDQLMVRTGSLERALTTPDGFFQMVEPAQAVFGTPNDPEDVLKMQFNWLKRQVIFLGDSDQNMIREKVSKYFTLTSNNKNVKEEVARMDADFSNTIQ